MGQLCVREARENRKSSFSSPPKSSRSGFTPDKHYANSSSMRESEQIRVDRAKHEGVDQTGAVSSSHEGQSLQFSHPNRKWSASFSEQSLQSMISNVREGERFESLTNEKKYFYSLRACADIKLKVEELLGLRHPIVDENQQQQQLHSSGNTMFGSISLMEKYLQTMEDHLLLIKEKFGLILQHEGEGGGGEDVAFFDESEIGYDESEPGISLSFDNQDALLVKSQASSRSSSSADPPKHQSDDSSHPRSAGELRDTQEEQRLKIREGLSNETVKQSHLHAREQPSVVTQQSTATDRLQLQSLDIYEQRTSRLSAKESFARLSERLQQPVLVIEFHNLFVNQGCDLSKRLLSSSVRFGIQVYFSQSSKRQTHRVVSPSIKLPSPGIQNSVAFDNSVYEFRSDIVMSESTSAKIKISMLKEIPAAAAAVTSSKEQISIKQQLASVDSQVIDIIEYKDQDIHYLTAVFRLPPTSGEEDNLEEISVNFRMQFVFDQCALIKKQLDGIHHVKGLIAHARNLNSSSNGNK